MELFVTIEYQEVITYLQNSSNLDEVDIVDPPLYATNFDFYDKIRSMEKDKDPEGFNPGAQLFHILVPSFFSRCEKYNLLLRLLRDSCSLIYLFNISIFKSQ